MAAEVLGEGDGEGGEAGGGAPASEPDRHTPLELRNRPWHVFAGELTARLVELTEAPVWAMDATETAETIVELSRAVEQLGGGLAVLLAAASRHDLAASCGATSTAAWLRSQVPVTPRTANQQVALGVAVESGAYPATAAALAAGVSAGRPGVPDELRGRGRGAVRPEPSWVSWRVR